MIRNFRVCFVLLSLCVTAVYGADRPQEPTPLVPIQRVPYSLPNPVVPNPVPHAPADLLRPLAVEKAPDADHAISPVQHLRRAADHLEAAAVGPIAEELCDRANELRKLADKVEEESTTRLNELREHLEKIQNEIHRLETFTQRSQQIQVDLQLIEIDMSSVKQQGLEVDFATNSPEEPFKLVSASQGPAIRFMLLPEGQAITSLDALVEHGFAKVLASPTLVTTSGRPATIHSGGEFPILVPQGEEKVNVEWREFGVRAEVLPVILDNGRVRLDIAPELSERDFSNSTKIKGMVVPGITTRRVNTQVEMEFGQTLVLAGLTSRLSNQTPHVQAVPILGHPYQGKLFKRVSHEEEPKEKRYIFLVTPTLVPHAER